MVEDVLHELETRLGLFDRLCVPVWVCDVEGTRVLWANPAALEVWGVASIDPLRGPTAGENMRTVLLAELETLRRGESFEAVYTVDGAFARRRLRLHHTPLSLSDGTLCVLVESLGSVEGTTFVAKRDELTGLLSRHGFLTRAEQMLADSRRCALVYVDLDGLKAVNDALGHAKGDLLIREAARRIIGHCPSDGAVGRLGGDEFTMMFETAASHRELQMIGDHIVASLSAPYDLDDDRIRAGASCGVVVYPDDATTVEDLVKRADFAMGRAKERGRGSAQLFSPSVYAQKQTSVELAKALRGALAEDELSLAFQPIVDDRSHRLRKIECLLRWESRAFGAVSPSQFIPIAEEMGVIRSLGSWVIREACRHARRWSAAGHDDVIVCVNVSGHQFLQRSFVDDVAMALETSGLPPEQLEMELTETVLMAQLDNAVAVMEELGAMGIKLAIDDFGTGYSSLAYLHTLPVGSLKVDRSFVSRLPQHAAASIVRATVSIARGLGLTVVAEGVETKRQRDELRRLGVDLMQGYLYARPMNESELLRWWPNGVRMASV